jgi:hypothetical protein
MDIKDIEELERLEEEENYQWEDIEHFTCLATTTKSISFDPSTVSLLSES